MKKIIAGAAALGMLVVPAVSLAATYHYVDVHGVINDVQASSAAEALAKLNAMDDSIHSGVKLDTGTLDEGDTYGHIYQYVSTSGSVKTVFAPSLDAASILASDRASNSGFLVVD